MKVKMSLIISLILMNSTAKAENFPHEDLIKTKLKISSLVAVDQGIRFELLALQKQYGMNFINKYPGFVKYWQSIDHNNCQELKKIINHWGWPDTKRFGILSSQAAFLIAQHADQDLAFQKTALISLKEISRHDKLELAHYAYLYDRVQANQKLPQKYGTQGQCLKKGVWTPLPMINDKKVDQWRATVGLEPLEAYKKVVGRYCY